MCFHTLNNCLPFGKREQNFDRHGGLAPSRRDPHFPPLFLKVDFLKATLLKLN